MGVTAAADSLPLDPLVWSVLIGTAVFGLLGYRAGRAHELLRAAATDYEALADARAERLSYVQRVTHEEAAARLRVLNFINEGVATFDAEGRITDRSAVFNRLIPHAAASPSIDRLLERCGAETETVEIVRLLLWKNASTAPFAATTDMLPKRWMVEIGSRTRHLAFFYRPIETADRRLAQVLMIVEDQTDLARSKAEHDATLERVERLSAAATDLEAYLGFVEDVTERIRIADRIRRTPDGSAGAVTATLNALKSTLGLFAYREAAAICHQLEQATALGDPVDALWTDLRRTWRIQSTDIAKTLGLTLARLVPVAPERIADLRQALGQGDLAAARQAALELRCHPLARVTARYKRYVEAKSERTGKQVRFIIANGSDEVAYHEVQRVDAALIALFDNVIEHAAQVRTPVRLTVRMLRREDGGQRWTVEDDGAGIDADQVAALAVQAGLRSPRWEEEADHHEKLQLIFDPNWARQQVGGRGLSVVRARMRSLGGDVRVSSAIDAGTLFELWIPGQASMDLSRWSETTETAESPATLKPPANAAAEARVEEEPDIFAEATEILIEGEDSTLVEGQAVGLDALAAMAAKDQALRQAAKVGDLMGSQDIRTAMVGSEGVEVIPLRKRKTRPAFDERASPADLGFESMDASALAIDADDGP